MGIVVVWISAVGTALTPKWPVVPMGVVVVACKLIGTVGAAEGFPRYTGLSCTVVVPGALVGAEILAVENRLGGG